MTIPESDLVGYVIAVVIGTALLLLFMCVIWPQVLHARGRDSIAAALRERSVHALARKQRWTGAPAHQQVAPATQPLTKPLGPRARAMQQQQTWKKAVS